MKGGLSQVASGKSWEFGLALQFAASFGLDIDEEKLAAGNRPYHDAYRKLTGQEREKFKLAGGRAAEFLLKHDPRLANAADIGFLQDGRGMDGDVRDIVITLAGGGEVGVSAKHRHGALKHSRLSNRIDFGAKWYEDACSPAYWAQVGPVFDELARMRSEKKQWKEVSAGYKHSIYRSVLDAFIGEVRAKAAPGKLTSYLLGREDFYKVIKANGDVVLESFNIKGTLRWGEKLLLPERIVEFKTRHSSGNTAVLVMDKGWAITFRIHNASSAVEPSLKFDIQLEGRPSRLARNQIFLG